MKKASILILMSIIAILSSCENTIEPLSNEANKLVNEFVYDGMSLYYFWESEMTGKKPGTQNSMQYFDGLLNSTDKQHGWSFITDDAKALQAQFGGNPVDFGYELAFGYVDSTKTSVFAVVEFVYPNSPAANAGLQRCDVITKIGGTTLNLSNYMLLLGRDAITITYYKSDPSQNFTASLAPATIETNPVLYTNIYEYNGHKIGYIFYTSFIANFNTALYQKFSEFKQAGITDLVVDLRYNRGGSISAAVYLASLIAPRNVVENQSVYTSLNFNDYLNNYYGSKRSYQLGTYETRFQNPLTANLNLNKVYIIATEGSYSASELT
ncbi:MAG: hypothetical protein LBV75_02040, partial [Paludibacter sp.]|nr:hypothetical protein [Paludibacter sp.]